MAPETGRREVFILRIWPGSSAEDAHWLGQVEHIRSGEKQPFQDLTALWRFLRDHAQLSDREPTPPPVDLPY